jgi:hypothetical protein
MSARLFIEGFEADTLGDIDVEFTFSVADITDIERRNTSFSKTLTLPSTARNQQLFGNIFDISVSNDIFEGANIGQNFNPAKQAKAQIFLDNVKIYDGVMRMMKINNLEGNIVYEVNMFGRLRDILHELGDLTLGDLDFSGPNVISYDHVWNQENIEASWERTEWVEGEQNYVYPLVDYGNSPDMITFPIENFKPAVFVSEILKRIFDQAGFTIVAPIFSSFYFRRLILITAERSITKEATKLLEQSSSFYTDSTGSDTTFSHILQFSNIEADGFTINPAGDTFTWNKPQSINTGLTFNAKVSFVATQAQVWNVWNMRVLINGVEDLQSSVNVRLENIGDTFNWDVEIAGPVTLVNGDEYQIQLTGEVFGGLGGSLETDVFIEADSIFQIGNTVPVSVELEEGDLMKIQYTLPKSMKQRDFFKSIISMYNLYVTQDRLQTNVLEIIPYNEFYQSFKNEALDWSDKLDYSQEISITPLSELSAKEYRFTFDDDTDYWSTFYKTKFNQAYGESRTIIPNDFELDTKTVKVVFAPPVMREQIAGQIMVHIYKVELTTTLGFAGKTPDNFKPRIAYFAPNQPTLTPWYIAFQGGAETYNTYPYAGHLDNPIEPITDVLFAAPQEVYFSTGIYPENTNLYTTYYDQLISSIGDRNSRLVEGYMYLTPTDISNLDFRKIIKLGNHFFQLQKVDKYNPMANGLSKVSLFKILGDLQPEDFDFILLENDSYMLQENGVNKFYI